LAFSQNESLESKTDKALARNEVAEWLHLTEVGSEWLLPKKQRGGTMKLLIIGVGGIGSMLTRELSKLLFNEQLKHKGENISITITDDDIVELKNIRYQNFKTKDIGKNKAEVLGNEYFMQYETERITEEKQLKGYDFIVSCVDNPATRKMIYEYCNKNAIYFIDTRSEGRAIAVFTKNEKNTTEYLNKTLDMNKGSSSCQLKYELENNIIQQGNIIVATICSQLILNYLRGEQNLSEYRFYF